MRTTNMAFSQFYALVTTVLLCSVVSTVSKSRADELPLVNHVELQPFSSATQRLIEAMRYIGSPLSDQDTRYLKAAMMSEDGPRAVEEIQRILDRYCLFGVHINPEARVKVMEGAVEKRLVQQGWRTFLVKVYNEAGVTGQLVAESPNAAPLFKRSTGRSAPEQTIPLGEVRQRFLEIQMYDSQPLKSGLGGLELEYRVIQLYSRDTGRREASFAFHIGQGTQDIGFRNEVAVLFNVVPSVEVVLDIRDHDGSPTTASFIIRDKLQRVYPTPSRRLAPDFFFHDQIYRHSGESVSLPSGTYEVEYTRGPEYHVLNRQMTVPESVSHRETFQLKRWIQLTNYGWYSGDHHVHAAGCSHYESPDEGVLPGDMMRHIQGEDLNVGCVLSWGPCWYFQKQFFEGKISALSTADYLMRYDVEVSGFPSSHSGHLCLLRLREDDYEYPQSSEFDWSYGPEKGHFNGKTTTQIGEWPSWDLPVLKWGQTQGAIVGFSHSGWGLEPVTHRDKDGRPLASTNELPNYVIPPFDSIGANEYIVDVVHDAVDFISTVDTPSVWELNIWYHTLNCGFRTRISGETDFPCIYGQKVGLGRVYVKEESADSSLQFDTWVKGLREGRSYVGDGLSHIMDFSVNGVAMGEEGNTGVISQLDLGRPRKVKVKAQVAAFLNEELSEEALRVRNTPLDEKPYWHLERSRIDESQLVPVELIMNGRPVARKEIKADGNVREVKFEVEIPHSSWLALRIYPSSHTNPIFVHVDDKPIRASRRSARWCVDSVDQCWKAKVGNIRKHERDAAAAAFDKAKKAYLQILAESVTE